MEDPRPDWYDGIMTTAEMLEHLRAEAMKLPEPERRALVRSLQETLDDDSDDGELHPDWDAELRRRIARIDDGSARVSTVDETMARVRARFGW